MASQDIQTTDEGAPGGLEITQTVALARAEIDQQVATAHAFPRSAARAQRAMLEMVNLDKESAEESMYALPVDGKPITGPSIRFAEALKTAWGNCAVGSRITEVNRTEQFVEAEAVFWDLETNVRTTIRSRRSIRGKNGRTYAERVIVTTCGAAASIAMREAILKGVPKQVWRAGYHSVLDTIKGDIKTLSERRSKAIASFAQWGVSADRIFARLEVGGVEDIGLDDLPELFAMYQSIKNGEAQVEDYFPAKGGTVHSAGSGPLDDAPEVTSGKQDATAAEAARKADDDAIAAKAKHDADAGAAAAKAAAESRNARNAEEKRIADEARASVAGRRAAAAEDRETAERAHDDQIGRQQESANADKGGGAEAPQVSREHNAAPPDKPTEAQLSKAAEDGARAYAKGLPKRAAPAPYREPGAEDLMAAWTGAYDKAKQADMGG